ncbi:MAG: hypothetical protein GTN81_00275 [Proteobacteria bacterium]|nr:hypothetical protein [Pseudomonadota bacterium]
MNTRKCVFLLILAAGIFGAGIRGHASDMGFGKISPEGAGFLAAPIHLAGSTYFSFRLDGGYYGHGYSFGYHRHRSRHDYYDRHRYKHRYYDRDYYYDRYPHKYKYRYKYKHRYPYKYKYYNRPYDRGYHYRKHRGYRYY